jgi:hypothetical protein
MYERRLSPGGRMIDDDTLSTNILQFAGKSFDYDSTLKVGDTEYAVFARTETATEAKLRPELVRLRVLAPRAWLVYDRTTDVLAFAQDREPTGPGRTRSAGSTALEPDEFRERGIEWIRTTWPEGLRVYVPKSEADRLLSAPGRDALRGLP